MELRMDLSLLGNFRLVYDFWSYRMFPKIIFTSKSQSSLHFRFILLALYSPFASYSNHTVLGVRLVITQLH